MNKISIIIPVFNEAEYITNLLNHLIKNASETHIKEIIVVDGGSSDDTQKVVLNTFPVFEKLKTNIQLVISKKGRAKQMNKGAKEATGGVLYFLHADSFPPKNFDKYIITEVTKGNNAGCFRMQFDSSHWWLKLAGWLTALPFKASRGGDQSQFITKKLFDDIGGYDERFEIYEDNDLIKKLYARKEYVVIPEWLTTSARCYQKNGVWKTQFHFWCIHLKSRLGASPSELKSYYKQNLVKT
ncbi:TIGR04283 family arsenosugar biosynthesis glycosyltransferase [Hyunsoonleella pacifica]|uniref:Glycosyltransferase n=1 Tax=Hyunsoonleella pacifica TaxID=1080224 RepID=A0A4Q9FNN8_9FLAO|nr:TIGR04283 family arsenosugar biosynthesis glycosyltransferase [Hyunsoonleella pacifica]TBN15584.1 glycosyltransferase [Hyunsoonleella pacifica]GGD21079.1 glycosyl hydrolase [Hyunsoonleella pacifica]